MNIDDVLGRPDLPKPQNADMDRVMEIVLEMKAITSENEGDPDAFFALWRKQIEDSIDFDVLAYQATQVALDICQVRTGLEFLTMRADRDAYMRFASIMQAFYDGFLLGTEFEKRGGHRG